ncbi:MAG: DUF4350 domain-containing protein [Pyrinomonadaceae bacterium]
MRQKLLTFLALFVLIFLLIGLNAVSYVKKNTEPDSEINPNRSTFNAGATGTRALFDLLAETGRKPLRWQQDFAALGGDSEKKPQTFVVIGALRKDFSPTEIEQLLRWVSLGGKLVVIDREPPKDLISTTANWKISAVENNFPAIEIDPSDQQAMTNKIPAGTPAQPTVFTQSVNAVQPSQFASSIKIEKISDDAAGSPTSTLPPVEDEDYSDDENAPPAPQPSPPKNVKIAKPAASPFIIKSPTAAIVTNAQRAPVVHIAGGEKNLLVDFPFGSGEVVFLSDPYIVSNAGVGLVDNAQLAINIVNANGGAIAFDEFHQGYGANQNQLLGYFAKTPVPAIFLQAALLVGLLFFTQSRRFARPLPASEPSRLSKLEYVSAMAELQSRTKAYDLAIENIYTDFRRRAAKFFGADNYTVTRRELALMIAERLKMNADEIENLMRQCEEITRGEPTNKREVLEITTRLRELEEKLSLKRSQNRLI